MEKCFRLAELGPALAELIFESGDDAGVHLADTGLRQPQSAADLLHGEFFVIVEDDDEPFEEKMARLVATLDEQFKEGARLEKAIRKNLRGLGYGG